MQLSDYIRIIRRRWLTIVVFTLVGLLAAGTYALLAPKSYVSSTRLFVNVQSSESNSAVDIVQGSSAAQQKVRSYADVVTSAGVLEPVIKDLHLDTSVQQLASRVTATAQVNSVIITIAVSGESAAETATIANAIGKSFSTIVVDSLESPASGGPSLVKIVTVEPAIPATMPASPRTGVSLGLGLLAGLAAGFTAALLRSTLDTRIHTTADVEAISSVPVIGGISFDASIKQRPLIVRSDPRSPRAEAFRALRTNLQFINLGSTNRCFVTTSALPSEGKSTTTANLAIALAESGARVALVDGDLRRPRLAELMGLEGAIGLSDVLIGRVELSDALQPWGRGKLSVLPAGSIPPNPSELLGSMGMHALIAELTAGHDYVLIDAPPVLPVTDAAVLSTLTSGAIVVTAVGRTTKNQLRSALDNLEKTGSRAVGSILTMMPVKGPNSYGYGSYDAYYGHDAAEPEAASTALGRGPAKRSHA